MQAFSPLFNQNRNKLVLWTTCGQDDQMYPKQIRCCPPGSPLAGKLLVAGSTTQYFRNADLSFASKQYLGGSASVANDADLNNIYMALSGRIYQCSLAIPYVAGTSLVISNIRMIDASGDPLYVYVTSNNATDGHGVRKVRKSDMTVVASILATGAGDGQFNNPLGIKYVNEGGTGYVYVCDTTNARIQKLNASDLTYVAQYSMWEGGAQPCDLDTDGTNWFVTTGAYVNKYDLSFTHATKTSTVCASYSLCIIPDQGDGYGATLAIVDSTNSHLERRKCSDLSAINSVGSAGTGETSSFDPTFTTTLPTSITAKFDDGYSEVLTRSGAGPYTYAHSWHGFSGYTFRNRGPHRCTYVCGGGLGAITETNCASDLITAIKNLGKTKVTSFTAYSNLQYTIYLSELSYAISIIAHAGTKTIGCLSGLNRSLVTLYLRSSPSVVGSLVDLPVTLITVELIECIGILPASISHLVKFNSINISSMWPTMSAAESVDIVIDSAWAARMSYTYMTGPSMRIGGTNPSPTGNYAAPSEGADWHEGPAGFWTPLTPKAKIYDLVENVNSEVRPAWVITYTA